MKKRLLGTILAALLLLPAFAVGADNAVTIPLAEQAGSDTALDTARAYLKGIGLPAAFIEEKQITRGELVRLLVQTGRQVELSGGSPFTDVPFNSNYAGAIYTAYQLSWIDGSGGQLFRPNDAATMAEALKMTVDMLGYRVYANLQGGYPSGYITLANRCNLLNGIEKDTARTLSGRDAAVLLSNALLAPIAMETGIGASIQYESNGATLLSQRYNLVRREGIVTATEYASYNSETHHAKSGCIELDGVSYQLDGDAAGLLGKRVITYAEYSSDTALKFVVPWRNESVTVWANEIDRMENFVLYQTDNTKHDLDRSVSVLYNGKAYPDWKEADFALKDGFVTLLDNNRDGSYDIAFLTDITYSELSSVDELNAVLLGKSGIYLDLGNEEAHFQMYRWDGRKLEGISTGAFTENSIVGFAVSKDGLLGTLWLCENRIEGTVTEEYDSSERRISIDDVPYRTASDLHARYGSLLGRSGIFTLGIDGAVAAVDADSSGASYGYIIDAMRERSIRGNLLIKALTESGSVVPLALDEKCRIDGELNAAKLENAIMPGGKAARQLVKYTLSPDKKTVINIDTEQMQTDSTAQPTQKNDELICYVKGLYSPVKSGSLIFSRFIANHASRIFVVPPLSQTEVLDEDFDVVSGSFFRNDAYYTVDAYDLDANGYPKTLVCYDKPVKTVSDGSTIAVVDRVSYFDSALADVGERELQDLRITLFHGGRFQNYYVAEGVNIQKGKGEKLAPGDVVRIEWKSNVITSLAVDFDAASMTFTTEGQNFVFGDSGFNRQISYTLASAAKRMGSQLFYTRTKNGTAYDYALNQLRPLLISNAPCVKVNRRSRLIKPIQSSEIYDYESAGGNASEMLICQYFWACSMVIVYE